MYKFATAVLVSLGVLVMGCDNKTKTEKTVKTVEKTVKTGDKTGDEKKSEEKKTEEKTEKSKTE
jgi:hypothetical protein